MLNVQTITGTVRSRKLILLFPFFIFQNKKISSEPLLDVDVRKQTINCTLIRDQNGLGFSIAGGRGSTLKDNTEVSRLKQKKLDENRTIH